MSPSRELAIQTLKVVKEMSKGTDLRTVLLVGGDSLEDQFGTVMQNPDMYSIVLSFTLMNSIVATPGRFLHLVVEMNLDLRSIQYAVFDEADRYRHPYTMLTLDSLKWDLKHNSLKFSINFLNHDKPYSSQLHSLPLSSSSQKQDYKILFLFV